MNLNYFTIFDIIPALIWLVILIAIANAQRSKHKELAHYKYFMPNLYLKVLFALAFSVYYVVIFGGGDTVAYFEVSRSLNKLLMENPGGYYEQMLSGPSGEMYSRLFSYRTGYPPGWIYREPEAFFVSKVYSLLGIITMNSYLAITFILAFIMAKVSWRLYEFVRNLGLNNDKWLAYGILFLPSVNFWCTGISKDTLVLIAALYLILFAFQIISKDRKLNWKSILVLLLCTYIISQTRSFILMAILLPLGLAYLLKFLRKLGMGSSGIIFVFFISIVAGFGFFGLSMANQSEEEFLAQSTTLQQAKVIQEDFEMNKIYGDKKYSIGEIQYSPVGLLRVFPTAVIAGIYRPFPWEALSPSLIFNGIESMFIIYFSLLFLFRSPWKKFMYIQTHEFLVFCMVFALLIAFMTGLTSGLFGVLVRVRAPLLPFLFVLLTLDWEKKLGVGKKEERS